jgi:hypothetical protein
MATRPQVTTTSEEQRTLVVQWVGITNGDDGVAVPFGYSPERTIQVFGSFGSGTLHLEGSLEPNNPTNWKVLTDPQGNPISLTSDSIETVMENTMWIRPRLVGGAAGSVTVLVMSRFK